ncbi:alpha/beta hydrolase [Thiohalocapsa halophila]|uniref:Alpha/beta hydrolase n=1 Tax=Thiohalocapsa halophila TaxID=69359 RepID=A0ABS1CDC8_9GAMM|nr:alpha/beta fold hydrolase [Thiohalocapsa halophila]MBK1629897.1 alpha/beta hydrolase [Thiohalocapsa halophila]
MSPWLALILGGILLAGLLPLGVHLGFRAPRVRADRSPADLGLAFEAVRIPTVRGRSLAGWLLPAPDSAATVVMVHGWGSNADQMLPLALPLTRAGFNVLLFDVRNHGASDADTFSSLPRFAEDLAAAITWLQQHRPAQAARLAVLGHSVGAGAALLEATRNASVSAVVSIGAFAHPAEVNRRYLAQVYMPKPVVWLVRRYVEWLIGYDFASIAPVNTIRRVRCPVLLVHGSRDRRVPVTDARRIAAAADPAQVTLFEVADADHDSVDLIEAHSSRLVRFLREASAAG